MIPKANAAVLGIAFAGVAVSLINVPDIPDMIADARDPLRLVQREQLRVDTLRQDIKDKKGPYQAAFEACVRDVAYLVYRSRSRDDLIATMQQISSEGPSVISHFRRAPDNHGLTSAVAKKGIIETRINIDFDQCAQDGVKKQVESAQAQLDLVIQDPQGRARNNIGGNLVFPLLVSGLALLAWRSARRDNTDIRPSGTATILPFQSRGPDV